MNFQMFKLILERQKNQRSNCQHPLDHGKAREFQKNIYFCFIDYAKAFDCVDHNKLWKILKEMGIPEDGGGIGQGDHFLPHKLINRTFECSEKPTKPLRNASRGHQAPRKASISALLTKPKPLTVWITINCGKFFKRWEQTT